MKFNLINRQKGHDGFYKTWHKPEGNMFLYVHSGSGSIVFNDKSYPMQRGALCFIGEDKYHYTFPEELEGYERSKLFIGAANLTELTKLLRDESDDVGLITPRSCAIGLLDVEDQKRAEDIFDRLERVLSNGTNQSGELYGAALQFINMICSSLSFKTSEPTSPVAHAIEYINSHISEKLTHEQICRESFLSKYHFCRLFKKQTGLTVMEYVLKTRTVMAKDLLDSGNFSVSEVSELCGFSSLSYFSRIFKEETSMTPLKYKSKSV